MVQTTLTLSDRTIERANIIAATTGSLETGIEKALMAENLIFKMKLHQSIRRKWTSQWKLVVSLCVFNH